jgi:nucleoside-diphosphate-sugar epimerase
MTNKHALVLGYGYVGTRLVRALLEVGVRVTATTASDDRLAGIEAAGARGFRADPLEPATLKPLSELGADVVFDLIRPQQLSPDRFTVWGTRNLAAMLAERPPEAVVYLSSTTVYDTRETGWIDESTKIHPSSAFGKARAEAERIYLDLHRERGFPVRICRAPAVYGPNRTLRPRLEGGAYSRQDDEEQWVSRIHVDDLVAGLIASWKRGRSGEVYLLCDDEPVTGRAYAELTAELLALPVPPPLPREDIRQELATGGYERRSPAGRYQNVRMRAELGVELRYPTVREGVPASLREEGVI